ncbi:MAG TPA: two-component regulator propeller domain-containing protein, partial [Chthoniobacterales bacterium]
MTFSRLLHPSCWNCWLRWVGCIFLGVLVLWSVPARALGGQESARRYQHTVWSAKDGIPGPVWAVAQTPDGYLWIASQAGLYRFDGVRFVLWSPGTGEKLPFSTVHALRVARDGSLWMGFDSGAVSRLRDGQVTNYFPGSGLPKGGILSVVEAGDGTMWACGQYGLSRFKNGVWQAVGKEMGFPAQGGQTLLADRAGNLWVATDGFNFGLSADRVRSNT